MRDAQEILVRPRRPVTARRVDAEGSWLRTRYGLPGRSSGGDVEAYFRATGRRPRDCWQMYLKTAIILAWLRRPYALLVFVAPTWWLAAAAGASRWRWRWRRSGSTSSTTAGTTRTRGPAWVNRLAALSLDLIGASSYLWQWKHVVFHHTYLERRRPGHRHRRRRARPAVAAPAAAGGSPLAAPVPVAALRPAGHRGTCSATSRSVVTGTDRRAPDPPPEGVGPGHLHRGQGRLLRPWPSGSRCCSTRGGWCCCSTRRDGWCSGVVLTVVFQLAHCVEEAEFPVPQADTGRDGRTRGRSTRCRRPWTSPAAAGCCAWLAGRVELPGRAPPVPADLPRPLPGDLADRRADVPGFRGAVRGPPIVLGGHRLALPLAAADGHAEHDGRIVDGDPRAAAGRPEVRIAGGRRRSRHPG